MELSEPPASAAPPAETGLMPRAPNIPTTRSPGPTPDLSPPFERVTILGSVSEATGEELSLDRPDLAAIAERHGVEVNDDWGPGKMVQELFEKLVEPVIWRPTFVCDFPREVSPLARPH